MAYLHRIRLKPGLDIKQLAKVLPANAYAEHQLIWRLFDEDASARDFLFRREQQGHWPIFYVLSQRDALDKDNLWDIETKNFQPELSAGQRLAFMLRANPVRVRKVSDDKAVKTRRRDDVVADLKKHKYIDRDMRPPMAEIIQEAGSTWIGERAQKCGFELESVYADGYQQQRFFKSSAKPPIVLSTLEYNGVLNVTDPDVFVDRLIKGIGHAKAFGCGLLLVRRV
jgi:CRISPR system Cascade subunit CasE